MWVDRQGRETPIAVIADQYLYPRVSPDGSRVAVSVQGPHAGIWLSDIDEPALKEPVLRSPTGARDDEDGTREAGEGDGLYTFLHAALA